MKLESVYAPVKREIDGVRKELNRLISTFDFKTTKQILDHFSKMPGKFLRPALLLLSGRAVCENPSEADLKTMVLTATGVELIHDASLIHDDILDNDMERRGQATLNSVWGIKIALLAGDVLYSRAFGILLSTLSTELLGQVVKLNETMCAAEIEQARTLNKDLTRSEYFQIIEGKTAAFMSLCCRLGASLAGGTAQEIESLAAFGLNFGLAYQLFDDRADGDLGCDQVDSPIEARLHAEKAIGALVSLKLSPARHKLVELVQHLVDSNT